MRVAIAGVSHWHLSLYLAELRQVSGVRIVGVSDYNIAIADATARQIGCTPYKSYQRMCELSRPDFVFALGVHADMAALGRYLVDQRIPFVMEKPCGVSTEEVSDLAKRCAAAQVFAAVPFVWRQSELLEEMRRRFVDHAVSYLSMRWIAGPPTRYVDSGCAWMLDPRRSGGGCTINLGVHLIDFARFIFGDETSVVSATMSNAAYGIGIEDYSVVLLKSGAKMAVAETGYLFPGPHSSFDIHFSIKTPQKYLIVTGPNTLLVFDNHGASTALGVKTTNVPHYPVFVRDVLERWASGREPLASMDDMAAAMKLVQDAYSLAGPVGHRQT